MSKLATVGRRPRRRTKRGKDQPSNEAMTHIVGTSRVLPYLFSTPAVVCIGIIMAFPVLLAIYRSWFESSPLEAEEPFVGLENYAGLFREAEFWDAAVRSGVFVVGVSVLGIVLAVMFAYALNRMTGGLRFVRGLTILPYIVSGVAVAVMFRILFNTDTGLPNQLIELLGGEGPAWLASSSLAMVVVIIAQVWSDLPLAVLLIFGGLQTIDRSYLDAALVDGATGWTRAKYVTLPLIAPQIALGGLFMSYRALTTLGTILALTGGGPGRATETLSLQMFRVGFTQFDTGKAMTLVVIIFIVNATFATFYQTAQRRFGGE